MNEILEKEFEKRVYQNLTEAETFEVYSYSMEGIENGVVQWASDLLNKSNMSQGLKELAVAGEAKRSIEALIVENEKFHCLFTNDQINNANDHLIACGYKKV